MSAIAPGRPNPSTQLPLSQLRPDYLSLVCIMAAGSHRTDRCLFPISSAVEPILIPSRHRRGPSTGGHQVYSLYATVDKARSLGSFLECRDTPPQRKHFHYLLSVVYITDAGRVASDFFFGPEARKAGTVARLTPMSANAPLQKTKRAEICSCRAPYRPLVEVDDVGVRNVGLGTRQPFVPVATADGHPVAPTLT